MRSSVSVSTLGERVVQDQDPRIAQQRPGDGGALLLAAGERDAALAHHRLVAVRKAFDIAGQPGQFGGVADLLPRGALHAERDVARRWWR